MSSAALTSTPKYVNPGASRWLLDTLLYRHLLMMLIKKGTTTRYYGSLLGWLWSYVRPAMQFFMYFVMIGMVLGLRRHIELFPLYLFSGIILLNFFNEATKSATNSITTNAALIKKIYVPRELFPVSSVISAFIHFLPQLAVLLVVYVFFGWQITWLGALEIVVALLILFTFVLGLGLFFGAINVPFRDAKNIIDVALMFSLWMSPVLYSYEMIRDVVPPWLFNLYQVNPVTVAVELFHSAFYRQIAASAAPAPDYMITNTLAAIGIVLGILLIGQVAFRRLEGNFAQDL